MSEFIPCVYCGGYLLHHPGCKYYRNKTRRVKLKKHAGNSVQLKGFEPLGYGCPLESLSTEP